MISAQSTSGNGGAAVPVTVSPIPLPVDIASGTINGQVNQALGVMPTYFFNYTSSGVDIQVGSFVQEVITGAAINAFTTIITNIAALIAANPTYIFISLQWVSWQEGFQPATPANSRSYLAATLVFIIP